MTPLIHASTYWTSQNIVLEPSQIGLESDTNQFKIGDGTTAWNDLSYYATVFEYAVASGTDTYACNFGKALIVSNNIPDYYTGLRIWVKFTNANTGACTLNMDGYGAKGIKKNVSTALASGDILAGGIYVLVYDGTNFQIEGVGSGGGSTYTVDNGLTENVATNFQLGGQLTHITSIGTVDDDSFYLEILGDAGNYSSNGILYVHGAQYGIGGQGSSVGVTGTADSIPLWAVNTATGRNNIVDGVVINRANANALTGMGVQIHTNLSDSAGGIDTASLLITKWSTPTAGNETAQWEVWLKTGGASETRKLAVAGSGQLILDKYGINTFAGVPTYALGTDASGNIVEFAVGGGGAVAGADKQVQYNDAGSFGAEAGFEYDKTTNILSVDTVDLDKAILTDIATPTAPATNSLILFSKDQNGLSVPHILDENGNEIEITRDNLTIVRNTSGASISKGSVVYITGATGSVPNVSKARANSLTTLPAYGIMYQTTANTGFGWMMVLGMIEKIDLSAFSIGDLLYVSSATAGLLTATKPVSPNYAQSMGVVLNNGVGNGVLQVFTRIVEVATTQASGTNDTSISTTAFVQQEITNLKKGSFGATWDGQGGVIGTGGWQEIIIPYAGTITDWVIDSYTPATGVAVSGSIIIELYRSGASIIGAGNKPTLAVASTNTASVSGWTSTAVAVGDKLYAYVSNSPVSCLKVTCTFKITKT